MKRPTTESETNHILKTAYGYAQKGEYQRAFDLCNWLIEDSSTEVAGYRERSAIKSHSGDVEGAIDDLKKVIELFPNEPADFHALGALQLRADLTSDAIHSLSRSIEVSIKNDAGYYLPSSYFLRAEAHARAGYFDQALDDCKNLPDNYKAYIQGRGMKSKEEIVRMASSNKKM